MNIMFGNISLGRKHNQILAEYYFKRVLTKLLFNAFNSYIIYNIENNIMKDICFTGLTINLMLVLEYN